MSRKMKIKLFLIILLIHAAPSIYAARFLNPVTDVCWQCMFPIKIGEIPLGEAGITCTLPVLGGETPICTCPIPVPPFVKVGASVVFWEPARIVEVVRNAYSMPMLGINSTAPNNSDKDNQNVDSDNGGSNNFHVHYYYFPAKLVLDGIIQAACISPEGLDVAYMTEIDPLWNDDKLAGLVNPEAALFANPVAQIACAADAFAAAGSCAIDAMPWCMGSSGSSYPLTGHSQDSNPIQATMGIAARIIYKMGRQGLLLDPGVNICAPVPTPIWVKSNYRMQIAMPIRDITCHPIGRTSLLWEQGKVIPGVDDGYMIWIAWRKRGCCAF